MTQGEHGNHCVIDSADDGVVTVTISNAGTLNILSTPVIEALTGDLEALRKQSELRVLVMRGSGDKAFIGGADIKEMGGLTRKTAERFITGLRGLCDALRYFPVPVIARMPGWSLGGGLEVALSCDIRIASDTARFGMPEIQLGIPSVIHAALMPRLIGKARTNWLILTGESIDAAQALTWGLVDRVVPLAELDAEVGRVASLLAGFGTHAVRQQKRLLREWEDRSVDQSIGESVAEFGRAFDTGEPQRYMSDFMQRSRKGKPAL